jgi:hypothetical protein
MAEHEAAFPENSPASFLDAGRGTLILISHLYACVPNNNGNSNSELFVKSETGREETIFEPASTMPLPHVNRETAFDNSDPRHG